MHRIWKGPLWSSALSIQCRNPFSYPRWVVFLILLEHVSDWDCSFYWERVCSFSGQFYYLQLVYCMKIWVWKTYFSLLCWNTRAELSLVAPSSDNLIFQDAHGSHHHVTSFSRSNFPSASHFLTGCLLIFTLNLFDHTAVKVTACLPLIFGVLQTVHQVNKLMQPIHRSWKRLLPWPPKPPWYPLIVILLPEGDTRWPLLAIL